MLRLLRALPCSPSWLGNAEHARHEAMAQLLPVPRRKGHRPPDGRRAPSSLHTTRRL